MNIFDKRTAQIVLTILLFAAALAFLYLARKPLIIFLFAMLFAYLLEPVILKVQPWLRNSRGLAIVAVYVIGLGCLTVIGFAAGPRIVDEGRKLAQTAPALYEKITTGNIAWQVGAQRGWSYETQAKVQHVLAEHRLEVLQYINSVAGRAATLAANAGWLGLVPILAIFLLKDKAKFSQAVQSFVEDRGERSLLRTVLADLDDMLSHFIRAQLYLAAISGVVYTTVLTLLHVPYSFVLGTIGGFLEFIPVVGPLVAAVLILGVAFTMNYPHMIVVLLFLGIWRIIQDYVVSPRVLGGKVELHPLAVLFGILVGGEIAGVIGVYLAIPAMATARILWRRWRTYRQLAKARTGPAIVRDAA